jgi:phage tail tape-measure protein
LFADEQLQRHEQSSSRRSEDEGLSGAEDVSLLVQQIRREAAGIKKKNFVLLLPVLIQMSIMLENICTNESVENSYAGLNYGYRYQLNDQYVRELLLERVR